MCDSYFNSINLGIMTLLKFTLHLRKKKTDMLP